MVIGMLPMATTQLNHFKEISLLAITCTRAHTHVYVCEFMFIHVYLKH